MSESVAVAVPRKGRPLVAVLERLATVGDCGELDRLADRVSNTLRYEKAVTKGALEVEVDPYERLAEYSDTTSPSAPEFTLMRDDRNGKPRRIVFDAATVRIDDAVVKLVGREEPFRALRTHEFALGFDSADLVLEEVVGIGRSGFGRLADVNERIDPLDTDVRIAAGLGDTVYHTLMGRPELLPPDGEFDREFIAEYGGRCCISPRYERLLTAVLGTDALADVEFVYPPKTVSAEESAIADVGLGMYLTETGSTAREHGLEVGEHLFPSETVLMHNEAESAPDIDRVREILAAAETNSALTA